MGTILRTAGWSTGFTGGIYMSGGMPTWARQSWIMYTLDLVVVTRNKVAELELKFCVLFPIC